MTNREVASNLEAKGYGLDFVERKDGSIRIRKIVSPSGEVLFNGSKNPSEGNKVARKLAGAKLSKKQKEQRTKANKKKTTTAKKKAKKEAKKKAVRKKKEKLSKSVEKALKKAQRQLNKAGKKGILNKKRVRKHKARTDARHTKKAIENIVQHEMGYAYAQSVADLIEFLKVNFSQDEGTGAVIKALTPFAKGRKLLQDHIVADIYDIYYDVGKYLRNEGGIPPKQGAEMSLSLINNNI